jgi:ribosome-associated translation inhibitor RaiA
MRIDVRAHRVGLPPALRDYAYNRVDAALAHAAGRVHTVLVVLSDENGPKGGEDKVCRVAARLAGGRAVVVEQTEPRVRAALDGATDRLRDAVDRHLDREVAARRRSKLARAVGAVMAAFGRGVRP